MSAVARNLAGGVSNLKSAHHVFIKTEGTNESQHGLP